MALVNNAMNEKMFFMGYIIYVYNSNPVDIIHVQVALVTLEISVACQYI